jgi:hypothetical protein
LLARIEPVSQRASHDSDQGKAMSTNTSLLPKEVTALVHHIELNRAGWWDKTVHRLVLAAVWLSDHTPNTDEIQATLKAQIRLSISKGKLSSVLSTLETQNDSARDYSGPRLASAATAELAEVPTLYPSALHRSAATTLLE